MIDECRANDGVSIEERQQLLHMADDLIGEAGIRGGQGDRGLRPMFCLADQVGCHDLRVCRGVCDYQCLARSGRQVDTDVPIDNQLGGTTPLDIIIDAPAEFFQAKEDSAENDSWFDELVEALDFTEDGIRRIAETAWQVNETTENIGARRLHTVMERLLESISFEASEHSGETITVDDSYVDAHLSKLAADEDLSQYIL